MPKRIVEIMGAKVEVEDGNPPMTKDLTMRDWFAAHALAASSYYQVSGLNASLDVAKTVDQAYMIADAMMEARAK